MQPGRRSLPPCMLRHGNVEKARSEKKHPQIPLSAARDATRRLSPHCLLQSVRQPTAHPMQQTRKRRAHHMSRSARWPGDGHVVAARGTPGPRGPPRTATVCATHISPPSDTAQASRGTALTLLLPAHPWRRMEQSGRWLAEKLTVQPSRVHLLLQGPPRPHTVSRACASRRWRSCCCR